MKTVEMADAVGPLSDYARRARREPCVVTVNGKPVVALLPVSLNTDLENIAVTMHPMFQAIMARSQGLYEAEGGLSTEQVRQRLAVRRKARRRRLQAK